MKTTWRRCRGGKLSWKIEKYNNFGGTEEDEEWMDTWMIYLEWIAKRGGWFNRKFFALEIKFIKIAKIIVCFYFLITQQTSLDKETRKMIMKIALKIHCL